MTFNVTTIVLFVVLGLAGVGLYCLLISRNMIKAVVGLQILVKGAVLAFILAGNITNQINTAQSLALTIIVADTIVAVIGLALAVQVRLRFGTLDLKSLTTLKR